VISVQVILEVYATWKWVMTLYILIEDSGCDFYDPQNRMNLNIPGTLCIA